MMKNRNLIKTKNSESSARGWGMAIGVVLVIVVMIGVCGGVPTLLATWTSEDTRAIYGDGSSYDPVAAFPTVQEYAGVNALLTEIVARYVRSDGTMDLFAEYSPIVNYNFYQMVDADGSSVPLGVPGSTRGSENSYQEISIDVWHPNQMRSVRSGSNSYTYMHLGMERDFGSPQRTIPGTAIPAPACSFADLWALARAKTDAPADAVATITYDSSGYRFEIYDTSIRLNFSEDCVLRP